MNLCCEDPANREAGPGPRGMEGAPSEVTVTHCTVCECRHYEVEVDPLHLGVKGQAL